MKGRHSAARDGIQSGRGLGSSGTERAGQWEEPLKGRIPMRQEPMEGGEDQTGFFCWRGLTLERRDGVFCGAVRTAGGRRGDS